MLAPPQLHKHSASNAATTRAIDRPFILPNLFMGVAPTVVLRTLSDFRASCALLIASESYRRSAKVRHPSAIVRLAIARKTQAAKPDCREFCDGMKAFHLAGLR